MSKVIHDAIVVTSWRRQDLVLARAKAKEMGLSVTYIVGPVVNSYYSFLIGPDGSKEGWEASAKGDVARQQWRNWARSVRESCYLEWKSVRYGNDLARQ